MSEAIEEILANCLERMETGASLESCLADFPQHAAELEPLLHMTQQMQQLASVGPRPAFAQSARLQLENQLSPAAKVVTFKRPNRHTKQEPKLFLQRRFSMSALQLIIAAVFALTATTGGAAYAANASSPGDLLHGLDLAMENVQLNLAPDVASQVQLRLEFAGERLEEAQTMFAKNDVGDGLEAMNEYGTQISTIAQLVSSEEGADQEALASLLETAHGVHQQVLTNLLDTVPDQAKEAIQKALDASNRVEETSAPATSDANAVNGNEAPGAPDGVGAPEGVGSPSAVDAPGAAIKECATSISQENAHALVDLAKKHGVDYQYVLENFCTAGTLEKVQEMLSQRQVPPTDIPAGPPSDRPAGQPSDTPGGQPSDTPGGRPSDTPAGAPASHPGRP